MKLVIEDESGTRSVVPFTGEAIVVGRAAEGVTFRLAERNVSRRHARFLRQNGTVFVEDLGSLTGTRVNGEKIAARRKLRPGDLVQIGDYDLAVLEEGAAAEPGAPPPLPVGARDPNAVTMRFEAPRPAPPEPPQRSRAVGLTLFAGAGALAAGAAAGWAVGALTAAP
jgi:pSer/pThr/pTyr-binding forkhead associated (FHA) protein